MRVGLLGPLEIEHDGHPVAVGGGRLRALLARLALDAGRPVTTGALVEAVWDGQAPDGQALEQRISALQADLPVRGGDDGYALELDRECIDSRRFEALLEAARKEADGGATLLVKGSRFMRMERVADALAGSAGEHHAA